MVWIGVDCHKWQHTAALLDADGQLLDYWQGGTTPADWQALLDWASAFGAPRHWGIEGSGHYGRGVAQFLLGQHETVVEVNPRLTVLGRRSRGSRAKNDLRDAEAIAAVVQAQGARLPPLQPADATAVLALWTAERDDLIAAATRLRNQLHGLISQAEPGAPKAKLDTLQAARGWQCYQTKQTDALSQVRAERIRQRAGQLATMLAEIQALARQIAAAAPAVAAPLQELVGVDWLTAGMLAGYLGPGQRFASDRQLAAYAGVAPLEVSSAGRTRHRLNRGGNRQLNAILHRIAWAQLRWSPEGQAYVARRMGEGKSQAEALRALKRHIARRVYQRWQRCLALLAATDSELQMT
jgi:transposase